MLERLVENWLDSVNERTFQVPFCQILLSEGHRIIHSTRHAPIELGKDVISQGPDGTVHAYQLKGHPGTRLTLNGWREIEPQIRELTSTSILDPEFKDKQHKSYLVTNGIVDEEVRVAIEKFNDANIRDGYMNRTLGLLDRGYLLKKFLSIGSSLWPTSIKRINQLIEIYISEGNDWYPVNKSHNILSEILFLDSSATKPGAAQLKRSIISASIFSFFTLSSYYRKENHSAIIHALIQLSSYIIAACEKWGVSVKMNAEPTIIMLREEIACRILLLAKEADGRDELIEGDSMSDFLFYRSRITFLIGLFSAYLLEFKDKAENSENNLILVNFIKKYEGKLFLWGEGAIPCTISYYWFSCRYNDKQYPETILLSIACAILSPKSQEKRYKISPYFTVSDRIRSEVDFLLGSRQNPLRNETIGLHSFTSSSIFYFLVRTGRKQFCKALWPQYTQLTSADFIPDNKWNYCLWRTNGGKEIHRQHRPKKGWSELIDELEQIDESYIPQRLLDDPFLHLLFCICFPQRFTYDTARILDGKLGYFGFYRNEKKNNSRSNNIG